MNSSKFRNEDILLINKIVNEMNNEKSRINEFENDYVDKIRIPSKVKKIWPYAFSFQSIDTLFIPYGVEEIGDYAFEDLYIKNEVTLPKSVNKIGKRVFGEINPYDDFVYARNIDGTIDKTILMGYIGRIKNDDLTIPEGVVEIRENVFNGVYNLNQVLLPNSLDKIGNNAFENTNITEISIPSSVKIIGEYAFYNNRNLKKVVFNDGLDKIGNNAFDNCKLGEMYNSLIVIPMTVMYVGDNAFGLNKLLFDIIGKDSFDDFEYLGNNSFGVDSIISFVPIEVN